MFGNHLQHVINFTPEGRRIYMVRTFDGCIFEGLSYDSARSKAYRHSCDMLRGIFAK